MSSKLSIETLKTGGPLLEEAIRKALSVNARTFEIRTKDEWLCSAYTLEIPKTSSSSRLEALVILATLQLHWLEGWALENTAEDDIRNIASVWLVPMFQGYKFQPIYALEIERRFEGFLEPLSAVIARATIENVEVIIDGAAANLGAVRILLSKPIVSGLSLEYSSNSIEFLYETREQYGLYSWGTGA